jgi:hypothetical protein
VSDLDGTSSGILYCTFVTDPKYADTAHGARNFSWTLVTYAGDGCTGPEYRTVNGTNDECVPVEALQSVTYLIVNCNSALQHAASISLLALLFVALQLLMHR